MNRPLLTKLGRFTRLSRSEQTLVAALLGGSQRQLASHADVVREGEAPKAVTVVLEGWACRYCLLEDGRRQIVSLFLPGDVCDLNVMVFRRLDHSIAALTPLVVADVIPGSLEAVMLGSPRLMQALMWDSMVAAAIQREWTINIGQRSAFERLAHLLCELFIRLEAVGLAQDNRGEMPLTQSELGEATGLSAVHVNRTLQDLRSAGLIVLKERTLVIPDLEALKIAALFDPAYLHLDREGSHLDANE